MTRAEKWGFTFTALPANHPVPLAFFTKHLIDNGYPLDTKPAANHWVAMVKDGRVYGVFGWHRLPTGDINVPDFYLYPGRIGVLAGYAAMERVRLEADRTGVSVLTLIPNSNTKMVAAFQKEFKVAAPGLVVYRYDPKPIATVERDSVVESREEPVLEGVLSAG